MQLNLFVLIVISDSVKFFLFYSFSHIVFGLYLFNSFLIFTFIHHVLAIYLHNKVRKEFIVDEGYEIAKIFRKIFRKK